MIPPNGGVRLPNVILVSGPYASAYGRTQGANVADAIRVGQLFLRLVPTIIQVTHGMASAGLYGDSRVGISQVHATQRQAWATLAGRLDGVLVALTLPVSSGEAVSEVEQDIAAFRAAGGRWEIQGTPPSMVASLEALVRAEQHPEVRLGVLARGIRDTLRGAGALKVGGSRGIVE